jgi:hypothetical protein
LLEPIEIQKNTIKQINKELTLSVFKPVLNTDNDLKQNLNIMISFFKNNKAKNLTNIFHFLYRLDLKEIEFENFLEYDIEHLVYLVFNRAKKKVVFKTNFD